MSAEWKERAEAAEKTVEVLTRKVMALYRGESATTIERQLERAQKRQERAFQRRQLSEVRSTELARYSESLEVDVAERTRALRIILDHVTSALLVIDANLVVRPGHSHSCHDLLGAEVIAGVALPQLLGVTDSRSQAHLRASVAQTFADVLPEEISVEMIPKRFSIGSRILNVDARVIRRDGGISGLLLTVSDVTSLEHAQREAHDNRTLVRILKERDAFRAFVSDARELLEAARDALAENNHAFVRRAAHTVKGNAAIFELDGVVELIHGIETQEVISLMEIGLIEKGLRAFLAQHNDVLEIDYGAAITDHFDVAASTMDELRALALPTGAGDAVERWTARVALKRADAILGPLDSYVSKLAERLEKSVDFRLSGGETMVDARLLRPVFQNLTHVLRNAVDHGVEELADRGGKAPRATIEIAMGETPDAWTLRIRDDGRGVDTNEIVRLAVANGVVSPEQAAGLNEREKIDLVFAEGLSTARCTTDISGRGVGMSAVRAAVHDSGGQLTIESTKGEGTTVVVSIPKPVALGGRADAAKHAA